MQREGQALVLHVEPGRPLRLRRGGDLVDHRSPRVGTRLHHELAVDHGLEPVEPVPLDGGRQVLSEEGDGTPRHDGDDGVAPGQCRQDLGRARKGTSILRHGHDRGQGAVEVEEDRRRRGVPAQGGERVHRCPPRISSRRRWCSSPPSWA